MYLLTVEAAARHEIDRVALWYAEEGIDIALDFLGQIDAALARLPDHPRGYAVVRGTIRRMPIPHYPYHLYYEILDHSIVVLTIMHSSRYPRFGHH